MAEEKIAGIMRDFVKSLSARDVEKGLSFCTDDAVWVTPMGTFKGKEELKRYMGGMARISPEMKVTDSGIGIVVQGNKAVYEHVISGTFQGQKWEVLAMCAYEFSNDKIKSMRTVFDRLLMAKQSARGWFATRAVNSIVNAMEKGLH